MVHSIHQEAFEFDRALLRCPDHLMQEGNKDNNGVSFMKILRVTTRCRAMSKSKGDATLERPLILGIGALAGLMDLST